MLITYRIMVLCYRYFRGSVVHTIYVLQHCHSGANEPTKRYILINFSISMAQVLVKTAFSSLDTVIQFYQGGLVRPGLEVARFHTLSKLLPSLNLVKPSCLLSKIAYSRSKPFIDEFCLQLCLNSGLIHRLSPDINPYS